MLYYETLNSQKSEWIVLIHGLGGSVRTWKKQIEDYSASYNLLLIDLLGHGNSQEECGVVPNKNLLETSAVGIAEVMDEVKIEKAHFVCLSLGTLVVAEFACRYPERISDIVLAGCILNLSHFKMGLVRMANFFKHFMPHRVLYRIFASMIMPKKEQSKSRHIFVREAIKMRHRSFCCWLTAMKERKLTGRFVAKMNEEKIPVMMVSGKNDYLFITGIKRMVGSLRNVTLDILEGAGHVCSIDSFARFNRDTLAFLTGKKKALTDKR